MQFLLRNSVLILYVIAVKVEQSDPVCSLCSRILSQYFTRWLLLKEANVRAAASLFT